VSEPQESFPPSQNAPSQPEPSQPEPSQPEPSPTASADSPRSEPRNESASSGPVRWRFSWRPIDAVLLLLLGLLAISQPIIWMSGWQPTMGDSVKNLITYSQGILAVVLVLGWWFLFAPVSFRTRLAVGMPVVLGILVWIASIRSLEFTGDMVIRLKYRWEPAADEILEAHRRSQSDPVAVEDEARAVPRAEPEDMPAYRGIARDGVVIGPPLSQDWETSPPPELWPRQPVGGGYSSFAIVEPYMVTLEQRGENEAVVCYDTRTGRERWDHRYPARFFEAMGGPGPRATPTIDEGLVFSFGAFGDLFCLDLLTGTVRWHVNALQQFNLPNAKWGMASSPLVHAGNVVVNIGGREGNGLAAYDIPTGSLQWYSGGLSEPDVSLTEFRTGAAAVPEGKPSKPGYSSPMLATIEGMLQIINFDGTAVRGHDPETGRELWSFPFKAGDNISVAQPIVFEDGRVFISSSYDGGSAMLRVNEESGVRSQESGEGHQESENQTLNTENSPWSVEQIWAHKTVMKCKFTSPVLHEGYLYGLDEGIMVCVDPADGQRMWKRGRYGHGQILLTQGQILVLSEQGEAVLLDATPDEFREVTRMRVLSEEKTWNPPALVRGRLYVRNAHEMAAYDLR
jgi:outer membrane protein assembly factor BamB